MTKPDRRFCLGRTTRSLQRWPLGPGCLGAALLAALLLLLPASGLRADTIEFMNGTKAACKVTELDPVQKTVTVLMVVGGRNLTRVYPYHLVHSVTKDGQRTVLTDRTGAAPTEAGTANASTRTPAQVQALINQVGSTSPDWLASTRLNHPQTLDLSWPERPPPPWNNQRHVGQFIWDIIHPNENRWREGVKLMYHLLALHQDNPRTRMRAMDSIAGMYFRLFQDYARAAWWWQQSGVEKWDPESLPLAECYWRLGSKQMALDSLRGQAMRVGAIKLLGDMGETEQALQLAAAYARAAPEPHEAYLYAGDACRLAGRYAEAMAYYQKVLQEPIPPNSKDWVNRLRNRAQANLEGIKLFELCDVSKVADGTYQDQSLGYEGQIRVAVTVKAGRIESVRIVQHREKQYYSALRDVPNQILAKQGVKGVDATSRATITAEAVINATAKALAKGVK